MKHPTIPLSGLENGAVCLNWQGESWEVPQRIPLGSTEEPSPALGHHVPGSFLYKSSSPLSHLPGPDLAGLQQEPE